MHDIKVITGQTFPASGPTGASRRAHDIYVDGQKIGYALHNGRSRDNSRIEFYWANDEKMFAPFRYVWPNKAKHSNNPDQLKRVIAYELGKIEIVVRSCLPAILDPTNMIKYRPNTDTNSVSKPEPTPEPVNADAVSQTTTAPPAPQSPPNPIAAKKPASREVELLSILTHLDRLDPTDPAAANYIAFPAYKALLQSAIKIVQC